jgi:hypothetical protein
VTGLVPVALAMTMRLGFALPGFRSFGELLGRSFRFGLWFARAAGCLEIEVGPEIVV